MTVLVTGASGFVGLNVVEALLAAGREVVAFGHVPMPDAARTAFAALPGRLHEVQGDVCSADDLARAFGGRAVAAVVHGAAVTPGAGQESTAMRRTVEVNVLGTVTALEAARAHGVGRVVHLSSASVYGANAFGPAALDEAETPPAPVETYAVTKLAGEKLALRFGALHGMRVTAARLGTAFGPWERATGVRETLSAIWQVTRMAREGREAVLPRVGRRDWAYARDLAGGILALLDAAAPQHAVYNLGPGECWTVADWCAKLAEAFPGFAWRIAGRPEEANVRLYGDRDRAPLAIDRIGGDLGFRPRFASLDAAFADYMDWIRSEGGTAC